MDNLVIAMNQEFATLLSLKGKLTRGLTVLEELLSTKSPRFSKLLSFMQVEIGKLISSHNEWDKIFEMRVQYLTSDKIPLLKADVDNEIAPFIKKVCSQVLNYEHQNVTNTSDDNVTQKQSFYKN